MDDSIWYDMIWFYMSWHYVVQIWYDIIHIYNNLTFIKFIKNIVYVHGHKSLMDNDWVTKNFIVL